MFISYWYTNIEFSCDPARWTWLELLTDYFIAAFYTIEMCIKMIAMGIFRKKKFPCWNMESTWLFYCYWWVCSSERCCSIIDDSHVKRKCDIMTLTFIQIWYSNAEKRGFVDARNSAMRTHIEMETWNVSPSTYALWLQTFS